MRTDGLWHVFAETGDPVAYLLYRSAGNGSRRNDQNKKRPGAEEHPRPQD